MSENETGTRVIEVANGLHRELGPGLLESVYEIVLSRELQDLGLQVERQVSIPISYKGSTLTKDSVPISSWNTRSS